MVEHIFRMSSVQRTLTIYVFDLKPGRRETVMSVLMQQMVMIGYIKSIKFCRKTGLIQKAHTSTCFDKRLIIGSQKTC